jgi:hypothetical protein
MLWSSTRLCRTRCKALFVCNCLSLSRLVSDLMDDDGRLWERKRCTYPCSFVECLFVVLDLTNDYVRSQTFSYMVSLVSTFHVFMRNQRLELAKCYWKRVL